MRLFFKMLKITALVISTLAGLFLLFLLVITVVDYRPDDITACEVRGEAEKVSAPDSIISITSWNLGYFGLGEKNDFFYDGGKMTMPDETYYRQCVDQAMDYLSEPAQGDICFFQEVDLDSKRSYRDNQVERLLKVFPGYQVAFAVNYKVLYVPVPVRKPQGHVNSCIATFSKFPSVENTRYAFSTGFAWPVGLFMLDRCFLLTRVPLQSGKDLVLINTHNEAFDKGSQRKQQLALLRETMVAEFTNGNYVIVGGDWNLNPLGYDPASFITGDKGRTIEPAIEKDFLPEEWKWAFDPSTPSNRNVDEAYAMGSTPTTIIDFFVVSPNISVVAVKTKNLGFRWSDHNPVRMEFQLR
jgi:endonuclease/exonuclease/phosphatase family metal-dependent hydrolase